MQDIHLKFAVSSLSCAPSSLMRPDELFLPKKTTKRTIERIVALKNALSPIFNDHEFSTSLHVGFLIDNILGKALLSANHLDVSSIDTPDILSLGQSMGTFATRLGSMTAKQIKNHIGWQLASVTTKESYIEKVTEGIDMLKADANIHFIRACTASWHESPVGEALIRLVAEKRKLNPSLAIAIEIHAWRQTPEEYFQFVIDLGKAHPEVPIYYDLDLGHIAEAVAQYETFEPGSAFTKRIAAIFEDPEIAKRIGIISLNQYNHVEKETHVALMDGAIDYHEIVRHLGEAARAEMLSVQPTILAEFSPFEYDTMISEAGIEYFRTLKAAFTITEQSASATLE